VSIILISIPSVPVFCLFKIISSLFRKNKSIIDSMINMMIAFSFGVLIGDVFLHIFPVLVLKSNYLFSNIKQKMLKRN
jgi:hypothetical protein